MVMLWRYNLMNLFNYIKPNTSNQILLRRNDLNNFLSIDFNILHNFFSFIVWIVKGSLTLLSYIVEPPSNRLTNHKRVTQLIGLLII